MGDAVALKRARAEGDRNPTGGGGGAVTRLKSSPQDPKGGLTSGGAPPIAGGSYSGSSTRTQRSVRHQEQGSSSSGGPSPKSSSASSPTREEAAPGVVSSPVAVAHTRVALSRAEKLRMARPSGVKATQPTWGRKKKKEKKATWGPFIRRVPGEIMRQY